MKYRKPLDENDERPLWNPIESNGNGREKFQVFQFSILLRSSIFNLSSPSFRIARDSRFVSARRVERFVCGVNILYTEARVCAWTISSISCIQTRKEFRHFRISKSCSNFLSEHVDLSKRSALCHRRYGIRAPRLLFTWLLHSDLARGSKGRRRPLAMNDGIIRIERSKNGRQMEGKKNFRRHARRMARGAIEEPLFVNITRRVASTNARNYDSAAPCNIIPH